MTTNDDRITRLRDMAETMTSSRFAMSLCEQYERTRRLSDKQWLWVEKLLRGDADEPRPAPVDLTPIVALLNHAARHLKRPALLVRAGGRDLRLGLAGETAKVPGSLTVTEDAGGPDRAWYGRVTREGVFEPSYRGRAQFAEILEALRLLAADPAKAAADYGRLTGRCCFCARQLTDPRSTDQGYGPVSAPRPSACRGARPKLRRLPIRRAPMTTIIGGISSR